MSYMNIVIDNYILPFYNSSSYYYPVTIHLHIDINETYSNESTTNKI